MQYKKKLLKIRKTGRVIKIKDGVRKGKTGVIIVSAPQIDDSSEMKERVVASPVFKTKEQEQFFAECAAKSMSINSFLKW